jgi:hypothetical protein
MTANTKTPPHAFVLKRGDGFFWNGDGCWTRIHEAWLYESVADVEASIAEDKASLRAYATTEASLTICVVDRARNVLSEKPFHDRLREEDLRALRERESHVYTVTLERVRPGRLFGMVNYEGAFLRVVCDLPRDDFHVPIVEIATGKLTYMAKTKPCYLFPGEQP